MNNCKNEVALLEEKLRKKEMEVHDISKQVKKKNFFIVLVLY